MGVQVVMGAMLQCSFGVAHSSLVVLPTNKVLDTTLAEISLQRAGKPQPAGEGASSANAQRGAQIMHTGEARRTEPPLHALRIRRLIQLAASICGGFAIVVGALVLAGAALGGVLASALRQAISPRV